MILLDRCRLYDIGMQLILIQLQLNFLLVLSSLICIEVQQHQIPWSVMTYSSSNICRNNLALCFELQGGKSAEKNKNKIFMGGLPTNVTEQQIRDAFAPFGKVGICNKACKHNGVICD